MNILVGWIWCPNWLCVYELLYLNLLFLQIQADNIMLKERKLNIAPAIKKQVKRRKRSLSQKWTGNEWGGRSKNNLMICFRGLLVNCNSYWVIYFSKPTASHMTWANPFSMVDIITVLQVGCVLCISLLASLQFPVSGTPYTYHNGLAMFTADTGQHTALGLALQQLPTKGGAATQSATQPFPLLYGENSFFL